MVIIWTDTWWPIWEWNHTNASYVRNHFLKLSICRYTWEPMQADGDRQTENIVLSPSRERNDGKISLNTERVAWKGDLCKSEKLGRLSALFTWVYRASIHDTTGFSLGPCLWAAPWRSFWPVHIRCLRRRTSWTDGDGFQRSSVSSFCMVFYVSFCTELFEFFAQDLKWLSHFALHCLFFCTGFEVI